MPVGLLQGFEKVHHPVESLEFRLLLEVKGEEGEAAGDGKY